MSSTERLKKESSLVQDVEPEKTGSAFESIYKETRNRICLLQYPPGMRLREEELASQFGVSRTPIRTVLRRLEFEGLVEISRQGGAVVTTIDLIRLKEVYQLRLRLTSFIGEMMTRRIPAETISTLSDLIERCRSMHDEYDREALGALYNEFHELMAGTISNKPLRQITNQLYFQTSRVWLQILPDLDWEQEVDIACQEMSDVLAALKESDRLEAGRVRHDHMVGLLNRVSGYLGSAIPPAA